MVRKRIKHQAIDEPVAIVLTPSEMAHHLDVYQAAKTLGVSTSRVYALGRSGVLMRVLARSATIAPLIAPPRPHPWQLAEQRRLAELSGWRSVPQIKKRAVHKAARKAERDSEHAARWKFRRENVFKLKAKRERARRRDEARARCREVFGRSMPPLMRAVTLTALRPLPKLSPLQRSSAVLDAPAASTPVANTPAASIAKLLAFPTPSQLARRSQ